MREASLQRPGHRLEMCTSGAASRTSSSSHGKQLCLEGTACCASHVLCMNRLLYNHWPFLFIESASLGMHQIQYARVADTTMNDRHFHRDTTVWKLPSHWHRVFPDLPKSPILPHKHDVANEIKIFGIGSLTGKSQHSTDQSR